MPRRRRISASLGPPGFQQDTRREEGPYVGLSPLGTLFLSFFHGSLGWLHGQPAVPHLRPRLHLKFKVHFSGCASLFLWPAPQHPLHQCIFFGHSLPSAPCSFLFHACFLFFFPAQSSLDPLRYFRRPHRNLHKDAGRHDDFRGQTGE